MSTRQKLREQSAVSKLVKDLNKRMGDFEAAVEELKILKDSLMDMHEEISKQESENARTLASLQNDLKENRTRILNEEARKTGKILIPLEEVEELKQNAERWKRECENMRKQSSEDVEERVQKEVEHQLKLLELEHSCNTAELAATNKNAEKEIENLKETIKRMSAELDSQKRLTADVARVGRSESRETQRHE